MDAFNYKSPEATSEQNSLTGEDDIKSGFSTLEKQNADLPRLNTRSSAKSMPGNNPSASISFPSPSFIWTCASVSKHSQSAEISVPSITFEKSSESSSPTTKSAPSSPFSATEVLSLSSRSSTPPPSVSSRSTTPVKDVLTDKQNRSRRAFVGQAMDEIWPSIRNLSSSFQSEYFVHASKKDRLVKSTVTDHTLKKLSTAVFERKRTPLKGRNTSEPSENLCLVQGEHSRVVDQHRWPAMKGGKVSTMNFSRSLDLTNRIGNAASFMLQSRSLSPARRDPQTNGITNYVQKSSSDVTQDSSLEATAKIEHCMKVDVNVASLNVHKEKALPYTNPSRMLSLPIVALCHPFSPNSVSVLPFSAYKKAPCSSGTSPSFLSFSPYNTVQIGNIYQLRLLYNRELQWRFVNSQAEVTLETHKLAAENLFNNLWNVTSELQNYISMEKHKFEALKQELKLRLLLKEQVAYLEDWMILEEEYSTSLFMTIEALMARALRLPVAGGARIDVRTVKNAFSSAIDIMQAMGSCVCFLLPLVKRTKHLICQLSAVATKEKKMLEEYVKRTKHLICQLSAVATKEKKMLEECRSFLAMTAAMKVEECSLRAHLLQQLRQDMHMWSRR